jgi:hypothetical protein
MKRNKIDLGAEFEKMKNPFPSNPMLSHTISDRLQTLSGGDMLSITVRDLAQNNQLAGAMKLVLSCTTDNFRMATEIFGGELIADIVQYMAEKAEEESPEDIPVDLYCQPGLFGYLGDN